MNTREFDFELPLELIAQEPAEPRSSSRLMVLDRSASTIEHTYFYHLPDYLKKGDLIVFNDTRVLPARVEVALENSSRGEILLIRNIKDNIWECLVKPGRKFREGRKIMIQEGGVEATVIGCSAQGLRLIDFRYEGNIIHILKKYGRIPLPPYIKKELKDFERYQTVFAKKEGSSAAPTAGLHFTSELIERINARGVDLVFVTLHIGPGTFKPISTERIENHKMHPEDFEISREAADKINKALQEGRRIIAVGTTVVRALESAFKGGKVERGENETDLYIVPGYEFKVVKAMITNFHLPRSTLLVLVSTFASRELILKAYNEAVKRQYRFFSFGDAMFIV